jgi:hypothetical protein
MTSMPNSRKRPVVFVGAPRSLSAMLEMVVARERAAGNEPVVSPEAPTHPAALRTELRRLESSYRRLFINPGGNVAYELEALVAWCVGKSYSFEWTEPLAGDKWTYKHRDRLLRRLPQLESIYQGTHEPKNPTPTHAATQATSNEDPGARERDRARARESAALAARARARAARYVDPRTVGAPGRQGQGREQPKARALSLAPGAPVALEAHAPPTLPSVLRPGTRLINLGEPLREVATLTTVKHRKSLLPESLFGTKPPEGDSVIYALTSGRWFLAEHVDWANWRGQG